MHKILHSIYKALYINTSFQVEVDLQEVQKLDRNQSMQEAYHTIKQNRGKVRKEDYSTCTSAVHACLSFPPSFHSKVDFLLVLIHALFLYFLQVHPYLLANIHSCSWKCEYILYNLSMARTRLVLLDECGIINPVKNPFMNYITNTSSAQLKPHTSDTWSLN